MRNGRAVDAPTDTDDAVVGLSFAYLPDLFGDDGQIGQVLANLLTNAHQAISDAGASGTLQLARLLRLR